jgi:hypothetical protein
MPLPLMLAATAAAAAAAAALRLLLLLLRCDGSLPMKDRPDEELCGGAPARAAAGVTPTPPAPRPPLTPLGAWVAASSNPSTAAVTSTVWCEEEDATTGEGSCEDAGAEGGAPTAEPATPGVGGTSSAWWCGVAGPSMPRIAASGGLT